MPTSVRGGAALPGNPLSIHLGASKAPGGSALPPNPLNTHLDGTAAPVASQPHAPVVPSTKPSIDPTISNRAANVTPAPGQRSGEAVAQRAALTQTPHGGATGMLAEWTGPSLAHLLTTGHVDSASGLGVDALGLLPLGKVVKGVKLGVDVVRAGRTAEEAAAHVSEVAAKAAGEGHGHMPLTVERGTVTPETGGDLGRQVREALAGREAKPPTSAVEPRVFPVKRDPVTGRSYPSGETHREYFHLMPKGDYLYHSTGSDSFAGIRAEGLKPGKERLGEPTGVYFAEKGSGVTILRPSNDRTGDVLLRVKRGDVSTQVTDTFEHGSGFEEHVSPKAVPPSHLEYLGADNGWHPVSLDPSVGLSAAEIRKAQKAGFSTERAARVAEAAAAGEKAGGGTAGHLAAKNYLAGALSHEHFGGLQHLTPDEVNQLHQHIDQAPLQFFEKTSARDAISNAVDRGVVPTQSEHDLLDRAFGKVAGVEGGQAKASSFWDKFVSYTNIPRAVKSSGDLSAGLRQGLVVLVTHPKVWGRAFSKSIRSFGSEEFYQAQNAAIHSDPLYPLFVKWKVPFTDIGDKVANTEEAFIGGQVAEHLHELPGINKIKPLSAALRPASNVIRRSDRAFTGFQNGTRFELAKILAEKASLLGHDLNDEHLGTSIAKVVGTFTGRGVTPKVLEGHLTTMNALMFSPRLMAARLNLLSPVYYAKLDPFARAEAMAGARNLVSAILGVMAVAKLLGAEVNFNPQSSNFTKIKIGNTRLDIAGGFSQYVRFVAQEMTRTAISSSGNKSHIGWGQNDVSDLSNLTKLGRSKAAPIPSLLWDEGSGKDFIGQPIKQGHEAWSNAPFIAQDAYDTGRTSGPRTAVVTSILSAIGLGVQSYKDKPPGSTGNQTTGGGEGYWGNTGTTGGGQGYWGP